MIPEDWDVTRLGDVAEVISGYAFKSQDFLEQGIPIIKIKNITPPNVVLDDVQYVSQLMYDTKEKYRVKYNDILISMTGSNISQFASAVGKIGRVKIKNKSMLLNQRVGKIYVKNPNKYDENFLYHYISTEQTKYALASIASGSANQANIDPKQIKNLFLPFPPIEEQVRIGDILDLLYKKIDLNNQMNKTLEQISQTLFKRWFIDFEFPDENGNPYKPSGGMMVDSELGEIPEGWGVGKLGDIAGEKRKNKKVENIEPETPYFGLEHIPRKSISLSEWGNASEISSNKLTFEKNDILFGKIRPYFHKVGVAPINGICSTDIIVISPKEDYLSLVLSIVSSEKFVEFATQTSEGTKMPRANWKTLVKYPVVIPDRETSKKYNEIVSTFVDVIQKNIFECKNLSQIRDSLLPKLMSGKIRVPI